MGRRQPDRSYRHHQSGRGSRGKLGEVVSFDSSLLPHHESKFRPALHWCLFQVGMGPSLPAAMSKLALDLARSATGLQKIPDEIAAGVFSDRECLSETGWTPLNAVPSSVK